MSQENQHLFLPQHGHYRQLRVYQVAEALYDLTYMFCKRFLPQHGDRTVDQMVQAARSGKQNIAEGNQAAATSSETEIKLTNVARASLEELLSDYEDYLRTRSLPQWDKSHPRFDGMRKWASNKEFLTTYTIKASMMNDEELANLCITLCHQTIYMLGRLLQTCRPGRHTRTDDRRPPRLPHRPTLKDGNPAAGKRRTPRPHSPTRRTNKTPDRKKI